MSPFEKWWKPIADKDEFAIAVKEIAELAWQEAQRQAYMDCVMICEEFTTTYQAESILQIEFIKAIRNKMKDLGYE